MNQKEKEYLESIKSSMSEDNTELEDQKVSGKLARDERECVLLYNEEEGTWYAESSIPKFWRRLEKKNWICIKTIYYADGSVCSKQFKGSKKGVTIGDPFKKRELTDAQRQAIRDRFSKSVEDEDVEDDIE